MANKIVVVVVVVHRARRSRTRPRGSARSPNSIHSQTQTLLDVPSNSQF